MEEFRCLTETRRSSGLNSPRQERLVRVAEELEAFNVRWLRWVNTLAGLRGVTVSALLESLELPARP